MSEELSDFFTDYANLVKSVGTLTKNKEGFGYSYLELAKLYDEIEPHIEKNNFIILANSRKTDSVIKRRYDGLVLSRDEDNKPTLTATCDYEIPCYEVHCELVHKSGKVVSCDLPLFVDDVDPQALGSAITYMRRYSIFILLNIKTKDDDGAAASARDKLRRENSPKEPLPQDVNEIATFLVRQSNPKAYYGEIKRRTDIPEELRKKLNKIMYPE